MYLPLTIVTPLIVGALIILIWIARAARRRDLRIGGDVNLSARLSKAGLLTYCIFPLNIVVGLAALFIWPNTRLGRWIGEIGLFNYLFLTIAIVVAVQLLLHGMGYATFRDPDRRRLELD